MKPLLVPSSKPKLSREEVERLVVAAKVREAVVLVGSRGYYRDSMGVRGRNDRGIYDDALFLVTPHVFAAFNANVDPSVNRRGIAVLQPGVWRYRVGIHGLSKPKSQQYRAFVQAAAVTVLRDDVGYETGFFGINIHRGGMSGTSSLGCQTVPPAQWAAFFALVESELKRVGQTTFPYVLAVNAE